jgi:type IV pilus assembly protein PilM
MARGRRVLGLDIGSNSIKILELKPYKKTYSLVKFGMEHLPSEAIVDGAVMNSSIVSSAISNLVRRHKVKTKDVAISVSGHSVIIKKINLPIMSDNELEESIQWEAEQYIPFDINDVNIDAQVLTRDKDSTSGQMEVLLVAAKKELINDYFAAVKEAGLNPAVVDVDAFALQNAFELNYQVKATDVVVLANIGASFVNLSVLREGASSFTRDISFGGNQYTEEIQKQANVSYEKAEELKFGRSPGGETELGVSTEIQSILDSVSTSLAAELQRSLDFYSATAVDEKIAKIYLSGGTAIIPGLSDIIEDKIGIPVEIMNPFKSLDVNPKVIDSEEIEKIGPIGAIALGLALRRVGD